MPYPRVQRELWGVTDPIFGPCPQGVVECASQGREVCVLLVSLSLSHTMQNEAGKKVDLYIPRKW